MGVDYPMEIDIYQCDNCEESFEVYCEGEIKYCPQCGTRLLIDDGSDYNNDCPYAAANVKNDELI